MLRLRFWLLQRNSDICSGHEWKLQIKSPSGKIILFVCKLFLGMEQKNLLQSSDEFQEMNQSKFQAIASEKNLLYLYDKGKKGDALPIHQGLSSDNH